MKTQPGRSQVLVGRSYTRSRRFPRMFGRMPGRDGAYVPGGPYTLTQGVLFLALLVIVWKIPIFGWLGPARWFLPLAAVFIRRARIESRTPVGWLIGLCTHLMAPASGLVEGKPYRPDRPLWIKSKIYIHPHEDRTEYSTEDNQVPEVLSPLQLLLARTEEVR